MKLLGLILAGGEGKRLGGQKPLKELAGKPLLYWAIKPYLELQIPFLISVRDKVQAKALREALKGLKLKGEKLQFVQDVEPFRGIGPLSGLYAALRASQEKTLILASAVDQPFLTRESLIPLLKLSQIFFSMALVYKTEDHLEPLPGVYPSTLLEELTTFLENSPKKSFQGFLKFLQKKNLLVFLKYLFKIKTEASPFYNINYLEDLKRAEGVFTS